MKTALQIDVKDASANRALGLFYMASGRVPEAEPYFKALAQVHAHRDRIAGAGRLLHRRQAPADARKVLRDVATRDQGYAAATVRLAALDAAEGNRAQAQDRLHEVLQKHPKDPRALLLSARVSVADGKRDEARRSVAAVIANEPNSPSAAQAYLLSGQIEALSDRTAEAIAAYEHVLKLQPRPWAANLALARLYLTQGNTDKASTYAQQALAIQPSNTEGQNLLIRAAIASGNLPRAQNGAGGAAEGVSRLRGSPQADRARAARVEAARCGACHLRADPADGTERLRSPFRHRAARPCGRTRQGSDRPGSTRT